MKRTIKFRGRRLDGKGWLYGDLAHKTYINQDGSYETWFYINAADRKEEIRRYRAKLFSNAIKPETVGQFTSLLDRNGKEVYEGDIITVRGHNPRVVVWDKASWSLMPCKYYHDKHFWVMNLQHPGNDWWEEFADEMEVIGNIYDNPELIGNEQPKS